MKKLFSIVCLLLICTMAHSEEIADYVLVEKSKHLLSLIKNGKSFANYHVSLGSHPVGHKEQEGDGKTPEGIYVLDSKNLNSAFNKSIHISYPNEADSAKAKAKGILAGGDIMIHGQKNGLGWLSFISQKTNWTQGCIALDNGDMDSVWKSVNIPVTIEIRP